MRLSLTADNIASLGVCVYDLATIVTTRQARHGARVPAGVGADRGAPPNAGNHPCNVGGQALAQEQFGLNTATPLRLSLRSCAVARGQELQRMRDQGREATPHHPGAGRIVVAGSRVGGALASLPAFALAAGRKRHQMGEGPLTPLRCRLSQEGERHHLVHRKRTYALGGVLMFT
jgi:hypothetical protein